MQVHTDNLIAFGIQWICIGAFVVYTYVKMGKEERTEARQDLISIKFIFTIGLIIIGYFLLSFEKVMKVSAIENIGLILFGIGGITSVIDLWKYSRMKAGFVLGMTALVISLYI